MEENGSGGQAVSKPDVFNIVNVATFVAFLIISVIAIYYRGPLLAFYGFYEPDGFFHYSVIRAAVAHGFIVPTTLSISGWPTHALITEPFGFYWVTLIPYAILQGSGISYYTIMRDIPMAFAILDIIGAYYLAKHFNKDKFFLILVMLFVGLSMGDAARTSATIYRGDGFVAIFLIASLIFMLRIFETRDQGKKMANAVISGFVLSVSDLVWNGASFGVAIYIIAFGIMVLYGMLREDGALLSDLSYVLGALGLWFVLVSVYRYTGVMQAQAFTGQYFILLYALMIAGLYLVTLLLRNKEQYSMFVSTPTRKVTTLALFALLAVGLIYFVTPVFVYEVFVGNGFGTQIAFAATIQELQPPTASFLFASFGPPLFLTPMSIALYFATFFISIRDVFWAISVVLFIPYLFMSTEGTAEDRFLSGRARVEFNLGPALIVLITYFAITAYLQLAAVRFNSLLSIPLAIFVAYTLYWIFLFFREQWRYSLVLFTLIQAYFLGTGNVPLIYWATLLGPVILYYITNSFKTTIVPQVALLLVLTAYIMYIDYGYTSHLSQADNINPQFESALNWAYNNTPKNSVFLTLWPDGSLIEGIANRTSITDSVGSQKRQIADPFAAWILNSSSDPQFLLAPNSSKPDYLLVRSTWLLETSGIFTESELDQNLSQLYAYNVFTNVQEVANLTQQSFNFSNPSSGLFAKLTIVLNKNGTQSLSSYLVLPSGRGVSAFSYVGFYNQINGTSRLVKQTAFNRTNNQMLLVQYSTVPNPNEPINVTGVYLFNTGMASSNMVKFIFFCSSQGCVWNNSVAGMKLVFSNADTKIFKIVYNATAH